MSDLQLVCDALTSINRDSIRMANELSQRAQVLKTAASQAALVTGNEKQVSGGSHAAIALQAAARAVEQAAQLLAKVAKEGEAFLTRNQQNGMGQSRSPRTDIAPSAQYVIDGVTRSEFIGAEFSTAAGSAFFYASDGIYRSASQDVSPFPGEYALDLHGTSNSVQLVDADGNVRELDASQFSEVVRKATGWAGEPVRLFSCDTGRNQEGFAQQLANQLGVPVTAPTAPVWSTPGGGLPIVSDLDWVKRDDVWVSLPKDPPSGTWVTFEPQLEQS